MDRFLKKYKSATAILLSYVIAAHITQAVEFPELAKAALNDIAQREKVEEGFELLCDGNEVEEGLEALFDFEMAAGMHLYIDRIDLVITFMKNMGFRDELSVRDAWWTLIFRAMLWHRGHDIIEGKTRGYGGIPVSPSFWGSRIPVYIA